MEDMSVFKNLIGSYISLKIAGLPVDIYGSLVDAGSDIVVVRREKQFYYIPVHHIKHMALATDESKDSYNQDFMAYPASNVEITLESVLASVMKMYAEIYVTGMHSLQGYITGIMSDCFTFHSLGSNKVLIQTKHLKYLIPYPPNAIPYSLPKEKLPIPTTPVKQERAFYQQILGMAGDFIVIDLADHSDKGGILKTVDQPMIELVMHNGSSALFHLDHIKTVTNTFHA